MKRFEAVRMSPGTMHCIILCLCVISAAQLPAANQSRHCGPTNTRNPCHAAACQAVKGLVVFSPELEAVAEGCALSKVQVI